MGWKEEMHEAVKKYCGLPEDATVTNFEEETISSGYCETCYYESTQVVVYYTLADGTDLEEESYLSMSEFLRSLED